MSSEPQPDPEPKRVLEDSDVVEVSTPHLDDAVRPRDRYGRADQR
jgi:hypothetical protein